MLLDVVMHYGLSPEWEASTAGGEYSSPCPVCGGRDRFRMQPNKQHKKCLGSYFCRQCGINGDTIKFCMDFLKDTYPQACQRLGISLDNVASVHSLIPQLKYVSIFQPTELIYPSQAWQDNALTFIDWAHNNLLNTHEICDLLAKRGIDLQSIKRYRFGYCPETLFRKKELWGMEDDGKLLWIPAGIVIPTFDESILRIKIRRTEYKPADILPKYVALSGGANGMSFIGDQLKRRGIVVESELDAFMIHAHLGNEVFVIGTGSCTRNPDILVHEIVSLCRNIFIAYDNDEGGQKMWNKWKSIYKHAYPAPVSLGKDIGEAVELGMDIKDWWKQLKG